MAKKAVKHEGTKDIEYISTDDAIKLLVDRGYLPVSKSTLIIWINKYKLGKKYGGRWMISMSKFIKFLDEFEIKDEFDLI